MMILITMKTLKPVIRVKKSKHCNYLVSSQSKTMRNISENIPTSTYFYI